MNAVAAQLSASDISNLAAYFEAQPGAAPGAKSALLPNIATTKMAFPEATSNRFTKYHTINFPAAKEVRYYYANGVALTAAKAGKPLPDGSVLFAEVYSAKLDGSNNPVCRNRWLFRSRQADAIHTQLVARSLVGEMDIPELLRNENWNYAVFTTANSISRGSIRPNA
jgi:hypothetical protein